MVTLGLGALPWGAATVCLSVSSVPRAQGAPIAQPCSNTALGAGGHSPQASGARHWDSLSKNGLVERKLPSHHLQLLLPHLSWFALEMGRRKRDFPTLLEALRARYTFLH